MKTIRLTILMLAMLTLPVSAARAHFLWLVRGGDEQAGEQIHLYFSESAEPDDPDLLERVKNVTLWQATPKGKPAKIALRKGEDSLWAQLSGAQIGNSLFVLRHDYGVLERGGEAFALRYYAKTGPALGAEAWSRVDCRKLVDLDLIPEQAGKDVRIRVLWRGQPLVGAEVKASGPGLDDFEALSDKQGQAIVPVADAGIYSIRVRHIEDQEGENEGKKFTAIRHYATLALQVPKKSGKSGVTARDASVSPYPVIPEMVTSFGAAISGDALYVYGGHSGRAHEYYKESQENTLRRLDLKTPKAWESLGNGPGLQGLAMVAHGGKLYRIGGFSAKNKEGEEHDLWSQSGVASYDLAAKKWQDLSPLPEPRSSFDAAVLGDKIYIIGGWKMEGDGEKKWHKTAYALDLLKKTPSWETLPEAPFERRALAVAAHDGKLFAIGGMQREGGPTTRVDVYDPASDKWSQGPNLQGKGMEGFGCSAFAVGERLYVTTMKGNLQRLASDGKSWKVLRQLKRARFFHRMLPLSDHLLLSVGGASMTEGKFEEIDVIDVR